MEERVDELQKNYKSIGRLDAASRALFLLSAIASVLSLYANLLPVGEEIVPVFFVLLVIAYSIASNFKALILAPTAERDRRKQLLSDALAIPLTHYRTKKYYNNGFEPSILRLGANIMENAHFGSRITSRMLPPERFRIGLYALVWAFALLNRSTGMDWVLIVTQVVFSAEVLFRWTRLEVLNQRLRTVYESLYSLYLKRKNFRSAQAEAEILDLFASYEAAKAYSSVYQSPKLFSKMNDDLSSEWETVKRAVGIPA